MLRARVELPHLVKFQARCRFMMLWTSAVGVGISPLRGSTVLGPTAFSVALGSQRTIEHVGPRR
jgi:hypothetical protein